ncbi:nucleoid-associated protein [Neorhizobium sp. CSC1952]|uniref:nucleoid-associated protein n=1 Tax=Neorhizobium sp. CSC1952 TaxID=2978974 RepID=UPI0025A5AB58|nr:nucleoid-associated protein [Rhizobium sp. CSC1952]WJR67248.1 nucleoid-associated protein [Rhizobium sp. CSC1952]
MANRIVNAQIHDLVRDEQGFRVVLGKPDFEVTKTAQWVIDSLYELYRRRSSKSHGKFAANDDLYPTQRQMKRYVEGKFKDFVALTTGLMETLKMQAGHKGAATGGHVFFAHFQAEGKDFLLVAIINEKLGAAITKDLDVQDVQHLDLDGFKFAGRINISAWAKQEERYISFLKGKGNVADYFKEFLGCETPVLEKQDTLGLVAALKSYADEQKMEQAERDLFLKKAKDICTGYSARREELSFEALSNQLVPDAPRKLLDALTDPDLLLNDQFVPDRRALGSLVKFQGHAKNWRIEFDRDAITGGEIKFHAASNSLTVTNLPEDLVAQLKDEYGNDEPNVR